MKRLIDPTSCTARALSARKVAGKANLADMIVALAGATPQPAFR